MFRRRIFPLFILIGLAAGVVSFIDLGRQAPLELNPFWRILEVVIAVPTGALFITFVIGFVLLIAYIGVKSGGFTEWFLYLSAMWVIGMIGVIIIMLQGHSLFAALG